MPCWWSSSRRWHRPLRPRFDEAETTRGYARLDHTSLAKFLDDVSPPETYPELHTILAETYKGEYGREVAEQSCLNFIYLIDAMTPDPFRVIGDSDERYHIHEGSAAVPLALAEAVGGDRVKLSQPVVAVRDAGGGYEVEFEDGSVESAGHVVFAVPFTALRRINLDGLSGLTERKRQIINEMGMGTNVKLIGGFSARPWWDDLNTSGACTSDLSFETCWDSGIGQDTGAVMTCFLGGVSGEQAEDAKASFQARLADLDTVFPGTAAAFDGATASHHWPSHPWTEGSYSCYLPGQWDFWGSEGRRQGNLHFCGEQTSLDFQGWMEGGAETGALVAAEILDDMGLSGSDTLARVVGVKTLAPQACYHGDRPASSDAVSGPSQAGQQAHRTTPGLTIPVMAGAVPRSCPPSPWDLNVRNRSHPAFAAGCGIDGHIWGPHHASATS